MVASTVELPVMLEVGFRVRGLHVETLELLEETNVIEAKKRRVGRKRLWRAMELSC